MKAKHLERDPMHRHRIFTIDAVSTHGMRGQHVSAISRSSDLEELGSVAQDYISDLGEAFCTGIGPMTTGNPPRSVDQNFEIFRLTYLNLVRSGGPGPTKVFYQLLFEYQIKKIADEHYDREHNGEAFYKDLFDMFYRPIMQHPNLKAVWRMPDWQNSTGAQIEFGILQARKEPVQFYDAIEHFPEIRRLLV